VHIGLTIVAIYIFIFFKGRLLKSSIEALIFFLLMSLLSYISIHFFPINNDELSYHLCAKEYASTILENYSAKSCNIFSPSNYFPKLYGIIYYFGGSNNFSILSLNYSFLFITFHLMSRLFTNSFDLRLKVFRASLICPPLLYIGLRPSKEPLVVFLISIILTGFSLKNKILSFLLMLIGVLLIYHIRWQYAVASIAAILLYGIIKIIMGNNKRLKGSLIFFLATITVLEFSVLGQVFEKTSQRFFYKTDVILTSLKPNAALVYALMETDIEKNTPLKPWNVLIAHVAGILTPHPLRVIKEWQREKLIKPQILEEFLFTTFWFFLFLPIFFIYIKDKLFWCFKDRKANLANVFLLSFLFYLVIFSMSSLTIISVTQAHFRYRLPCHIFMFIGLISYFYQLGYDKIKLRIYANRFLIISYSGFMFFYSILYLNIS
jgi:hypothetical protein